MEPAPVPWWHGECWRWSCFLGGILFLFFVTVTLRDIKSMKVFLDTFFAPRFWLAGTKVRHWMLGWSWCKVREFSSPLPGYHRSAIELEYKTLWNSMDTPGLLIKLRLIGQLLWVWSVDLANSLWIIRIARTIPTSMLSWRFNVQSHAGRVRRADLQERSDQFHIIPYYINQNTAVYTHGGTNTSVPLYTVFGEWERFFRLKRTCLSKVKQSIERPCDFRTMPRKIMEEISRQANDFFSEEWCLFGTFLALGWKDGDDEIGVHGFDGHCSSLLISTNSYAYDLVRLRESFWRYLIVFVQTFSKMQFLQV